MTEVIALRSGRGSSAGTSIFGLNNKEEVHQGPTASVIELEGVIRSGKGRGVLNLKNLEDQIDAAFSKEAYPNLQTVILRINCPGGSPEESLLIQERIMMRAKERGVPVVASVGELAASGGLMLAMAADQIFCGRSSYMGSIGVISAGFDFSDSIKKLGVKRRLETTGPFKGAGDAFTKQTPEQEAYRKEIRDDIFEIFKANVTERRGDILSRMDSPDKVWVGQKSVDMGLADDIKSFNQIEAELEAQGISVVKQKGEKNRMRALFGISADAEGVENSQPLSAQAILAALQAAEEKAMWERYPGVQAPRNSNA